jgi:hypothetical protein
MNSGIDQEPSLAELLAEPIIRQLMASDGVATETLCNLLAEQRLRISGLGSGGRDIPCAVA